MMNDSVRLVEFIQGIYKLVHFAGQGLYFLCNLKNNMIFIQIDAQPHIAYCIIHLFCMENDCFKILKYLLNHPDILVKFLDLSLTFIWARENIFKYCFSFMSPVFILMSYKKSKLEIIHYTFMK